MFNIDKTFEFCYGHRVWSQELDGRFSEDLKCACRHLHGHEAKVQVFLSSDTLVRGMVTDFRHLEWLKKWLNTFIDHKFVIDRNDPLRLILFPETSRLQPVELEGVEVAWTVENDSMSPLLQELYGGMLVVDFVPTSENFAKWMHTLVSIKMKALGVTCSRVDWWETPKSRSSFISNTNKD